MTIRTAYAVRSAAQWAAALAVALVACGPALAVFSEDRSETEFATVTLGADRDVAAPGDRVTLVLHQDLARGWHTYWINPGDSGVAAQLNWTAPDGVAVGGVEWPAPEQIPVPPLMTYGYTDEATLVSAFDVPEDWPVGRPVEISLSAMWLVCEHICVQEVGTFDLSIPTGAEPVVDTLHADLAAAARAAGPDAFVGSAEAVAADGGLTLRIAPEGAAGPSRVMNAYFFPHDRDLIDMAAEQTAVAAETGFEMRLSAAAVAADRPISGVLRYIDLSGETPTFETVELTVPVEATVVDGSAVDAAAAAAGGDAGLIETRPDGFAAAAGGELGLTLLAAAGLAVLGGALLNLMPCVFPVLALKALSIASASAAPARERYVHGGAYAGGVVLSFLAFAAVIAALQAAGGSAGWGFQLQNPLVVGALAYLMFAVGLNLSGVFEISLGSAAGAGSSLAARGGPAGSFFTGVLAALVASPCTAPFMGAAVGFAATQEPAAAFVVFGAMGVGFAAPMALLNVAPSVARLLPKPGPWMVRFRQLLAFPMYLAAAWLVWVVGRLSGPDAMFQAGVGLVLIGFAAWALGSGRPGAVRMRAVAAAAALVALVGAGSLLSSEIAERPGFDRARIDALRADGRTVFVNVTADWCISCKANERVALAGGAFDATLRDADAVYMPVDFTQPDEEIFAYLQEFGRAGVPLYVVYHGDAEPMILPQILTPGIVRDAIVTQ